MPSVPGMKYGGTYYLPEIPVQLAHVCDAVMAVNNSNVLVGNKEVDKNYIPIADKLNYIYYMLDERVSAIADTCSHSFGAGVRIYDDFFKNGAPDLYNPVSWRVFIESATMIYNKICGYYAMPPPYYLRDLFSSYGSGVNDCNMTTDDGLALGAESYNNKYYQFYWYKMHTFPEIPNPENINVELLIPELVKNNWKLDVMVNYRLANKEDGDTYDGPNSQIFFNPEFVFHQDKLTLNIKLGYVWGEGGTLSRYLYVTNYADVLAFRPGCPLTPSLVAMLTTRHNLNFFSKRKQAGSCLSVFDRFSYYKTHKNLQKNLNNKIKCPVDDILIDQWCENMMVCLQLLKFAKQGDPRVSQQYSICASNNYGDMQNSRFGGNLKDAAARGEHPNMFNSMENNVLTPQMCNLYNYNGGLKNRPIITPEGPSGQDALFGDSVHLGWKFFRKFEEMSYETCRANPHPSTGHTCTPITSSHEDYNVEPYFTEFHPTLSLGANTTWTCFGVPSWPPDYGLNCGHPNISSATVHCSANVHGFYKVGTSNDVDMPLYALATYFDNFCSTGTWYGVTGVSIGKCIPFPYGETVAQTIVDRVRHHDEGSDNPSGPYIWNTIQQSFNNNIYSHTNAFFPLPRYYGGSYSTAFSYVDPDSSSYSGRSKVFAHYNYTGMAFNLQDSLKYMLRVYTPPPPDVGESVLPGLTNGHLTEFTFDYNMHYYGIWDNFLN